MASLTNPTQQIPPHKFFKDNLIYAFDHMSVGVLFISRLSDRNITGTFILLDGSITHKVCVQRKNVNTSQAKKKLKSLYITSCKNITKFRNGFSF